MYAIEPVSSARRNLSLTVAVVIAAILALGLTFLTPG